MIHVVIGTKAQLIKMAPIMAALKKMGIPYNHISTGQHRETMDDILDNFELPQPQVKLYEGPDIVSIKQMVFWMFRILWKTLFNRREIFGGDRKGIVLVHGDTFSTLLGALMGRCARLDVGHVESGLRSFNLFQPFPEELTRLGTFFLSNYYFCPNEWCVQNLKKYSGPKILTHGNTLYDSLKRAQKVVLKSKAPIPAYPYGVVTLHRFENFKSTEDTMVIVKCLEQIAAKSRFLFVLHKPTEMYLKKYGLFDRIASNPAIECRPRYDYFTFVKILQAAQFVVSDGGSNQEECYYMGKPTLLLRNVSERQEGIGANVLISQFDPAKIESFLSNLGQYTKPPVEFVDSPSEIIARYCVQWQGAGQHIK